MDLNELSGLPADTPGECDATDVKISENEEDDEEDDGINSAMSCDMAEQDELDPVVRCRSNTWACSLQGGVETQESGIMVGETPGSSRESLVPLKKATSGRRNAWGSKSYADIITQAIEASPDHRLTLSQIYEWMTTNIPYFSDRGDGVHSAGWKNSIRHNLSLHDRFKRLPNEAGGKSSYWVNNYDAINKKASRHRAFTLDTKQYEKKRTMARNRLKAHHLGAAELNRASGGDSDTDLRLKDFLGIAGADGSNASSLHRLSPIEPINEGDELQMSFLPTASSFPASASAALLEGGSSPLVRWGEDITDDDDGYLLPPYAAWDNNDGVLETNQQISDNNEREGREVQDLRSRCDEVETANRNHENKCDVKANLNWGERVGSNLRRDDLFFNEVDAPGSSGGDFGGPNGSCNIGLIAALDEFNTYDNTTVSEHNSSYAQNCLPSQLQHEHLSDMMQMMLLKQQQQQQQVGSGCEDSSISLLAPQHQQPAFRAKDTTLHGLLQQQSLLSEQHTSGQLLRATKAHNDATLRSTSTVAHQVTAVANNSKPPLASMSNSDYLKLLKLPEFWKWGNPAMLAKIREVLLAKRASTVAAAAEQQARNRNMKQAQEEQQLEQLLQLRSVQELSDMLADGERLIREDSAALTKNCASKSSSSSSSAAATTVINSQQRWTDSEAVSADDVDGVTDLGEDLDFDDARYEDVNQVIRQDLLGYDDDASGGVLDFNLDMTAAQQLLLTENDIDENK